MSDFWKFGEEKSSKGKFYSSLLGKKTVIENMNMC